MYSLSKSFKISRNDLVSFFHDMCLRKASFGMFHDAYGTESFHFIPFIVREAEWMNTGVPNTALHETYNRVFGSSFVSILPGFLVPARDNGEIPQSKTFVTISRVTLPGMTTPPPSRPYLVAMITSLDIVISKYARRNSILHVSLAGWRKGDALFA